MILVDFSLFESDHADVPAKFGDHRSYINGDINSYISSYMETLEKAKPTASVRNIGRFLKSWITICNFKVPDTAGTKTRKRRRRRTQAIAKRYTFHANAKSNCCSNLILLQSFYSLGWNIVLMGSFCLIIDTLLFLPFWLILNYFIISTRKWSYQYSTGQVIFLYQLNYFFLMPSEIYKEYREP